MQLYRDTHDIDSDPMTEDFLTVAFLIRWMPILMEEKKLDNKLQEWDLLCDQAADLISKFKEWLMSMELSVLGIEQRQFYATWQTIDSNNVKIADSTICSTRQFEKLNKTA